MNQTMTVVVLGASRYDFEDEKTGRSISGTKVHYVPVGADDSVDNQVGLIPKAETMPYEFFGKIVTVPGIYEANVQMQMSGRSLRAKITDFKFVEPVTFELPVPK